MTSTQQVQLEVVLSAARAARPVWEGDNRVTLRDVYTQCQAQGTDDGMAWGEFCALCLDLRRAGALTLTRWDLCNDPDRRALTEVSDRGHEVHFIAI